MNIIERCEYEFLRSLGWAAQHAFRCAKVRARFRDLETQGKVRLTCEHETEPHDFSYLDTWGLSPKRRESEEKSIRRIIERDGLWCWSAEFFDGVRWRHVISVGDYIGDSFKDSAEDTDLMDHAVDAYEEHERTMLDDAREEARLAFQRRYPTCACPSCACNLVRLAGGGLNALGREIGPVRWCCVYCGDALLGLAVPRSTRLFRGVVFECLDVVRLTAPMG